MESYSIFFSFDKSVGQVNGMVEILVTNNQNLRDALEEACKKIGIISNENFQVSNINGTLLDINGSIEYNEITKCCQLIVTEPGKETSAHGNYNDYITTTNRLWKPLAIVGLLFSIAGLIILVTIYIISCQGIYSYAIVIDAGSTSSKIYLYSWPSNKFTYNAKVSQESRCKVDPGISDYENNPNMSFNGIKNCLDNSIVPNIPKEKKAASYIFLGATAGMRMLAYKNPNVTDEIMNFIRQSLSAYALKINNSLADIAIISGATEGLGGWITLNYLLDNFKESGNLDSPVIGALDMGGGSSQITFLDNNFNNSMDVVPVKLYGKTYRLYSHSYLCYGKSEAELRFLAVLIYQNNFTLLNNNPCMFQGEKAVFPVEEIFFQPCVYGKFAIDHYGFEIIPPDNITNKNVSFTFKGTSDHKLCDSLVNSLFNVSKCDFKTDCTFNGVYQPKPVGKFGAFSAYTLINANLNPTNANYNLTRYKQELVSKCNKRTKLSDVNEDKYAKWLCFDLTFLIKMLEKLGFSDLNWMNIDFIKTIKDYNIGWSLGYMIEKTTLLPKEQHLLPLQTYLFGIIAVVLILILIFATIFMIMSIQKMGKRVNCTDVYCDSNEEQNLLSSARN